MATVSAPCERPLLASAVDGEVVLLSSETALAVSLTPEAALQTSDLLKAAGLSALEQQRYRRSEPDSGRPPRDGDPAA